MNESVAIVTGASQGIGQATAIRLARDFRALALVARNRSNLEQTAEAVGTAGAHALIIDADLSQPPAAQTVVDQTLAAFGRIDALLNIAGAVPQIDLFDMTDEQWENGLALKLHGAAVDPGGMACPEARQRRRRVDLGKLRPLPPRALRSGRHDQCRHRRPGEGVLRPRHPRRPPSRQRTAWAGHDRPPAIVSAAWGAAARHDGQGGDGQLSEGGRHRPLR